MGIQNFIKILLKQNSEQNKFKKQSFSQCGEDLIIEHIFRGKIDKPTYLDIGAHHPWYLNNTAKFYLKGCKGVNIEPDSHLFEKFIIERIEDINLNIGIAGKSGELDFYVMQAKTLNTFSKSEAEKYEKENNYKITDKKKIKVNTLKFIIDKYFDGVSPDFVSIDVEGMDFEIVKQIDFDNYPPKIICIETISFSETGHGKKNHELIKFITNRGYINYADTFINTIFVLKKFWQNDTKNQT